LRRSSSTSHRQPTRSSSAARADDWSIGSKARSSPRGIARRSIRRIREVISCRATAAPHEHIHAIQIEIDRRLYLDAGLTTPGEGLAATALLLRRMIDAAADELLAGGLALAAE
jgi:hypothetical protein